MLVDCPSCTHSYRLDAVALGARGRSLICSHCDARWFEPGTPPREAVPPTAPAPVMSASPAPVRLRLHRGAVAAAFLLAVLAAAVGARVPIVRAMPRTAGVYAAAGWPVNLRGLAIARLRSEARGPDDALGQGEAGATVVAGAVRNLSHHRLRLPRLAFEVRDGAGAVLASWSDTLPAATLAADAELAFASRPRHLPPDGRTVLAHFSDDAGEAPAAP